MDILTEKKKLRQEVLLKRSQLAPAERERMSREAAGKLLDFSPLVRQKAIFLFSSYGDEIDTRPLIQQAMQRGQEVWLPLTVADEKRIVPYVYEKDSMLRQGVYGIWEPDPTRSKKADVSRLGAVILPGVAFDANGGRLGYGGGYYDRFLAQLTHKPLLIGYGFSMQMVEHVPTEQHDQKLDFLVIESGVIGPFHS